MSQLPLLSSQLPPSSSVFPSPTLGASIPLLLAKCLHVCCIERLRNEANVCPYCAMVGVLYTQSRARV